MGIEELEKWNRKTGLRRDEFEGIEVCFDFWFFWGRTKSRNTKFEA